MAEIVEEKDVDEPKQKTVKDVIIRRRPSQSKKKLSNQTKDDHRKSLLAGADPHAILGQIAEDMIEEEDGSDSETADTKESEGDRKKVWELTNDQETQIKLMSEQYGVDVDALKGYLQTKAANNHFNWVGIKRFEQKVDMNLEISKLESEYE